MAKRTTKRPAKPSLDHDPCLEGEGFILRVIVVPGTPTHKRLEQFNRKDMPGYNSQLDRYEVNISGVPWAGIRIALEAWGCNPDLGRIEVMRPGVLDEEPTYYWGIDHQLLKALL